MIQFAVVDIETTGGSADQSSITEIAIRVWDGVSLVDRFDSLVNPQVPIPFSIQSLTGITPEMVAEAPTFAELAESIFNILKERVFVAHNVHFDFSFIHSSLLQSGYELRAKKLCTVRLSRKILPGIPSYSLGRLTEYLSIPHLSRHRAGGDADATLLLLEHLVKSDTQSIIQKSLKQESSLGKFPPQLPIEDINRLPDKPGVYFFKNQKGKVIYVGKALNIKKRIISHFTGNSIKKQKQEFIQKVASISTAIQATELMALLFESHEIKRLWPELNRAQKRREDTYGLTEYTDQSGYRRLGIDKMKPSFPSFYTFGYYLQGIEILRILCREFNLEPVLCSLAKKTRNLLFESDAPENQSPEPKPITHELKADPTSLPIPIAEYNSRVEMAINFLKKDRSFAILDKGFTGDEQSCILILRGEWVGMGYIPTGIQNGTILHHIKKLKPLKLNGFIRQTLYSYAVGNPDIISIIPDEDLNHYENTKLKKQEKLTYSPYSDKNKINDGMYDYESETLLF